MHRTMIRMDRFATLYFCHPLKWAFSNGHAPQLPILMYHGIRERLDGRHPYYETSTTPAAFARHMQFLKDEGYRALNLDEAVSKLSAGASCGKQVAITFDDGYRDFYTDAFPVLRKYGFPATLFVPTGSIGNERKCVNGNEYLTWAEVRELHSNGIAIGSHTVTHPELKSMSYPQIDQELGDSRRMIEDKLGAAVKTFAYPYAFPETDHSFANRLEILLGKHGYESGVTTIIGMATGRSPRYFLPRLPVNSWDDLRLFRAKLEGGYNWLHAPQRVSKSIKGFFRSRRANGDLQSTSAQ